MSRLRDFTPLPPAFGTQLLDRVREWVFTVGVEDLVALTLIAVILLLAALLYN